MSVKLNKSQIALMVSLVAATLGAEQMLYVAEKVAAPLVSAGLAEQNPDMKNDAGELATRATADGIAAYPVADAGSQTEAPAAVPTSKPSFAIAEVEMPASKRAGRSGSASYPFEHLAVGQSFFVPATTKRPNPAKQLGSTVTSANERFSEEVAGETRTNRKGNTVPVTRQLRKFEIRHMVDGAAWGAEHAGVEGAGIWRTL